MDFISSIIRRYIIQNDTKAINIITPEKIQTEQKAQKPRRSVLKEFDPFAPESPQLNQLKSKRVAIDEEDTFEDAQTSFTNFLSVKSQNDASTVLVEGEGNKAIFNNSCLIPDLRVYAPTNPSDISDACYVEAVENLSQAPDLLSNATHSDEEIEFHSKSYNKVDVKGETEQQSQNIENRQDTSDYHNLNTTIEATKADECLIIQVSDKIEDVPQNLSSKTLDPTVEIPELVEIERESPSSTTVIPELNKTEEELQNMEQDQHMSVSQSSNSTVEIPKTDVTIEISDKIVETVSNEEIELKNEEELNNIQNDQDIPESKRLNSTIEVPKSNFVCEENTEKTKDVKASIDLHSTFNTGINPTEAKLSICNNIPEDVSLQLLNATENTDANTEDIKNEICDIKEEETSKNTDTQDKNIFNIIDKTFEALTNSRKSYEKEHCFNQTFEAVCKPEPKDDEIPKTSTSVDVLNGTYTEKQEVNSKCEKNPQQNVDDVNSSITNLNNTYMEEKKSKDLDETLEALQENDKENFVNSTMIQPAKDGNILEKSLLAIKQSNPNETFKKVSSPPDHEHQEGDQDCESEKELQSLKELEQMANSLNQTIDVEESAIIQEVNGSLSPNESGEAGILNKTIEGKVEHPVVPVESVVDLNEIPAKSRLSLRVSCRPSIKSLANKSDIESCNKTISDTPPTTPSIKTNPSKNSSCDEKVIETYKNENAALNNRIVELQKEMSKIKSEQKTIEKQVLSQKLTKSDQKEKYILLLEKYSHVINKQDQDLRAAKAEYEKCNEVFVKTEMAFSDLFERYQKARFVIENYKKNEEILEANVQLAEDQLAKLKDKYRALEGRYNEERGKANEEMQKEKQKQDSESTKLQAIVKRLEIKISSLETALKQKTEECQALSALCDDITGHP
ncbi:hypothetical protein GWI33_009049 [Rhynchophorus ferrugineus]|uniref:Transforming acidic coiled-coil-containing protein C-terminal domain-containing protein n=1 Tax=Rhynchophorus ferrugineus TaxID=354439 RepID=A0A834IQ17_RHYFE|nr:hypothetical protein GWI33_009049 [Rhynchophorus ferrugineus]